MSSPSIERGAVVKPARAAALSGLVVLGLLWLSASAASAHVTVHPSTIVAGTNDFELHFYVPNERNDANTVRLQLFMPTTPPLPEVDVLPVPGWSAHVATVTLRRPIETDDGPIDQAVTSIDLTATTGGTPPGQFEDFTLLIASGPSRPGALAFKALQTYSNGEIVRWIELPSPQIPEPQFPAPVLTVVPAPSHSATPAHVSSSSSGTVNSTAEVLAVIALVLAAGAVVIGVIALVRRRRTASGSPPAGE